MGSVYEAEQREPIRRRVALKLIRPVLRSEEVLARFDNERRSLALMDHPNIARVFEAGTADDGRPYFAMELVEGLPITEFCDRRSLGVRERLELFRTVCDAIEHAHRRGVVHRDIKPSNVLVTEVDGRAFPKIIDFGIAKATAAELTGGEVHTLAGQPLGTLTYMSPEQAGTVDFAVDERADVYSLGALLYHLLVGRPPFGDRTERGWMTLARRIREEEPSRPSTQVSAERAAALGSERGGGPRAVRRTLEGDLDWITLKALAKEPYRRYASPAELAASVAHHLEHEPVRAGPPTPGYLARKFMARHRLGVVQSFSASLVLVVSIVALSLALTGRRWEESARRQAERTQAVTELLTSSLAALEVAAADIDGAGVEDSPSVDTLGRAARRLRDALEAGPPVRVELLLTLAGIYVKLGDLERARATIDEVQAEVDLRTDDALRGRFLATEAGWLLGAGRPFEAMDTARAALDAQGEDGPAEWLARTHAVLGRALVAAGDVEAGLEELAVSREILLSQSP
ncbi:MAG TPA: serine/threonine-protein kinase [Thermoanaerobaculia bacterium]|nr:serine/threonine-protein kinase [Thermoanaerobaculia bacterium]